jgi:hypothetical protein
LAGIKCGHCGKEHDAGTKFCPDTGKSIGPPAGGRATMLMFQQPGTKLPGSSSGPPTGTPPAIPRTPGMTPGSGPVSARPVGATPSGAVPLPPPRTTPTGGMPPRPRTTPVSIPVPTKMNEVPPPPVSADAVPRPPVGSTPVEGVPTNDKSGPRRKSMPDWVAAPQGGGSGHLPSAMHPAVDAPEKGIVDIIKEAFALYKQHAKVFLITAAVLYIPGALVSSGLLALIRAPVAAVSTVDVEAYAKRMEEFQQRVAKGEVTPEDVKRFEADMQVGAAAAGVMLGGLAAMLLGLLAWAVTMLVLFMIITPLIEGALTIAVADRTLGGEGRWQDYWRWLFKRLGPFLAAVIPAAIICFITFPFLGLALVLAFFWCLVPMVVLVEGVGGMAALKRSFKLVKSDWLRVLLVLIVFGILNFVGSMIGGLLIPDRLIFFDTFMGHLVSLVLLPLPVLALVLVYLDIRRKKEKFDREALRTELEGLRTSPVAAEG